MVTTVRLMMASLFAVAAPTASLDPALWAQWGLAGVVVAYVLWRDHNRERRMSTAIESQQCWIRDTLLGAMERNAKSMERMARSFEQNTRFNTTSRRLEAFDGDHA